MSEHPVIPAEHAAGAVEILRLASSASATSARLKELSAASAAAQAKIEEAAAAQQRRVREEAEHKRRLAELTVRQVEEHAKRTKEISTREAALESGKRELVKEFDRANTLARAAEQRAEYLQRRLSGAA
jgi:hypothetical protein